MLRHTPVSYVTDKQCDLDLSQHAFRKMKRELIYYKEKIKEANQKNESCEEKDEVVERMINTLEFSGNFSIWFHPESMLCAKGEGVTMACYVSIKTIRRYSQLAYFESVIFRFTSLNFVP